jgi:CRP-like cAMP-binding protein
LLLVDQARSWSSGHGRSLEDYLQICPEIAVDRVLMVKLLAREYCWQENAQTVSEFVDRFPLLRTDLLRKLYGDYEGAGTSGNQYEQVLDEYLPDGTYASERSEALDTAIEASGALRQPTGSASAAEITLARLAARRVPPVPKKPISEQCLLHECFPFDSLPVDLVDKLEKHMEERIYSPTEYLTRQGDPGNCLFLIKKGTVGIIVTDEHGVAHEIDRSGAGDVLGEMALLTEEKRSASLIAHDAVTARMLSAETFHEAATIHPEISQVLTKLLAQRLGGQRRDVLAGKTLDNYRIARHLGRGGMAIVYEGTHKQSNQRVALKMLSHRLVYDKSSLAWFQREADLIESFQHPNIVQMFGRFQAFRTFFIVMEFCDGITLERLVRLNGPLSQADFRKAFGQVAAAVLYAHQRKVVHRDIKPVNVMLNFDGQLKLMDFGLAKPLRASPSDAEIDSHIVGTPRYMAPEQLKGREVTEVADYFALGCMAYKLLTGDSLFVEHDVSKLRELHDRWRVPDFATQRPDFAPDICELLTGCLQRRRSRRVCDLTKYAAWAAPLEVTRLL